MGFHGLKLRKRPVQTAPPDPRRPITQYAAFVRSGAVFAAIGDVSTAGAWFLAAFTPALLRALVVLAAVAFRERRGVELFLWYELEDGSNVTMLGTHPRSMPLGTA